MLVDCDTCAVRGAACGGCVVSVVLGAPPGGVELDEDERRALAVLADAGMVPRLQLVTESGGSAPPEAVPVPGDGPCDATRSDPSADRYWPEPSVAGTGPGPAPAARAERGRRRARRVA
jgi:hypothetical protein